MQAGAGAAAAPFFIFARGLAAASARPDYAPMAPSTFNIRLSV